MECPTTFCDPEYHPWEQLIENVPKIGFVSKGFIKQYRYFYDFSKMVDPSQCVMVTFKVEALSGIFSNFSHYILIELLFIFDCIILIFFCFF